MKKATKTTKKKFDANRYEKDLKSRLKNPKYRAALEAEKIKLDVAHIVIVLRGKNGLTQKEFANIIGVSQQEVSDIEKAKRNISLEMLNKIASGFGTRPEINFIPVKGRHKKIPVHI